METPSPRSVDEEFREWRQRRIDEQEQIRSRHQPDAQGRCIACVAVGLMYHRSQALWPCGTYREAERIINLISGKPLDGS